MKLLEIRERNISLLSTSPIQQASHRYFWSGSQIDY